MGAGAAGLVSVRELLREGHSVTVFEQGSDLGGIWIYSDDLEEDLLGLKPDRRHVHSSLEVASFPDDSWQECIQHCLLLNKQFAVVILGETFATSALSA